MYVSTTDIQHHLTFEATETYHSKLLYMAVTRAKKYLVLCPSMVDVLSKAKEHFFQPMLLKKAKTVRMYTTGQLICSQPLSFLTLIFLAHFPSAVPVVKIFHHNRFASGGKDIKYTPRYILHVYHYNQSFL